MQECREKLVLIQIPTLDQKVTSVRHPQTECPLAHSPPIHQMLSSISWLSARGHYRERYDRVALSSHIPSQRLEPHQGEKGQSIHQGPLCLLAQFSQNCDLRYAYSQAIKTLVSVK